ncbi:MAG TPA: 5,6-dimethylbenzimidazole synthase [Nitrospiria bacterium]|nr:5,6-dimethylbenzimidazole synthase [Nitrospiria bacterium]
MYEAIYRRRDVRRFLPRPVSDKVLRRILRAAHQAGSIGVMQPWNFLVVRDAEIKRRVKQEFLRASEEVGRGAEDGQQHMDQSLTAEAIEQAPINLAVTCDRSRRPHVASRHDTPDPDLVETCCAIQNLWLAGRAEGVGVGGVNILDPSAIAGILGLPAGIVLVAYLCMGHVARFPDAPTLETAGGESRLSLESVLFYDQWGNRGQETHHHEELTDSTPSRRTGRSLPRGSREP